MNSFGLACCGLHKVVVSEPAFFPWYDVLKTFEFFFEFLPVECSNYVRLPAKIKRATALFFLSMKKSQSLGFFRTRSEEFDPIGDWGKGKSSALEN